MNNYEWIKARTIEEMALVLTNLEFKTYDEIRQKLASNIPPLTDKDTIELFNNNLKMLNENSED